jgi:hypothetical protein
VIIVLVGPLLFPFSVPLLPRRAADRFDPALDAGRALLDPGEQPCLNAPCGAHRSRGQRTKSPAPATDSLIVSAVFCPLR